MSPLRRLAISLSCLVLPALAWAQQPAQDAHVRGSENRNAGARQGIEQRRDHDPGSPQAYAADHRRNLSEAVRRVQRRTGGQILGAEVVPFEGRNISRIKYMDDRGRVRYMDDPGPGERLRPAPPRRDNNEQP